MRSSLNPVVSYRILNPLQGGTSIRPYGPGTSRDCSAVTHQPSSQAEPGSSAPDRVSHRFTTFAKPLSPTRRLQRLPLLCFTLLKPTDSSPCPCNLEVRQTTVGARSYCGYTTVFRSDKFLPRNLDASIIDGLNATITPHSRGSWS